jgi:hypothetical protein
MAEAQLRALSNGEVIARFRAAFDDEFNAQQWIDTLAQTYTERQYIGIMRAALRIYDAGVLPIVFDDIVSAIVAALQHDADNSITNTTQ